ncbi:MAG: selenium cofactor biosynthesis protein YqeC [Clostridia bacterium]|nr:selenium cofactor biosynthesis protein YqeC [Clostridia bacterium]
MEQKKAANADYNVNNVRCGPMKLFDALSLSKRDVVSLVGGGGKTSTMFALSREAKDRGLKTALTTTTRIYCPPNPELPLILTQKLHEPFSAVFDNLLTFPTVLIGADISTENKLAGIHPSLVPQILEAGAALVIVEADGAARKPFKAPANHEPVIPEATTVVIPVVGVDCLDRPIHGDYIHRPEMVAQLGGVALGERLTPEVVAKVLTHNLGFRKDIPANCRWIPFINKVETKQDLEQARKIAQMVGNIIPCRVIIGAVKNLNPVVEVIDF